MNNLKLRMFFFVPYNISEIQKGIQAGHAAIDYAVRFGRTKLFHEFSNYHKTWIILNGGTTNDDNGMGDMNAIRDTLFENDIPFGFFKEPDLNNALTAICFICDERVFDFDMCSDLDTENINEFNLDDLYKKWFTELGGTKNIIMRDLIRGKRLA
jgi:hypothetical protein